MKKVVCHRQKLKRSYKSNPLFFWKRVVLRLSRPVSDIVLCPSLWQFHLEISVASGTLQVTEK